MSFNKIVEVKSVFPGQLGGAVFTGIPVGQKARLSFVGSYKVLDTAPKPGEYWNVEGYEVNSKEYGLTVNISSASIRPLPSRYLVGQFLKSHPSFRGFGLGKSKVDKLLKDIGEFALVDLLNNGNEPALSDVLSPVIANRLVIEWQRLKEKTELISFLMENGFDSRLATKVLRICRFNVVDRIKNNPYALLPFTKMRKVDFKLIDKVASNLCLPKDHDNRMTAAVEFVLYNESESGHTAAELNHLAEKIESLRIGHLPSGLDCIKAALKQKAVCVYKEGGKTFIQSIGIAFIEQSVEKSLLKLSKAPVQMDIFGSTDDALYSRIGTYNTRHKKDHGYLLTQAQVNAVHMGLSHRLSILSGFGGTGKTSITRAIVEISEQLNRPVYVAALAGKAKERAREVIGRDTFTIHGLIKELKKEKSAYIDKHANPTFIIDEASMIDIILINLFLKAAGDISFSLMLIGDTAQLPPVGCGIFWHELAKSENIPSTHLNEVHRQLSESPLHNAAMNIRNGIQHELSVWNNETEGVFLLPAHRTSEQEEQQLISLNSKGAKILTPFQSAKRSISTTRLNKLLQKNINTSEDGLIVGTTTLRENDPVLITKNSYALELFNGMTGTILTLGRSEEDPDGFVVISLDGRDEQVILSKIDCYEVGLELGYALTVHKSQGSEYESCVVMMDDSGYMDRSMLYTGLTRARRLCLIAANQATYDRAVINPPRIDSVVHGFRWG